MSGHRSRNQGHGSGHGKSHGRQGEYREPESYGDQGAPFRNYGDQPRGRYDDTSYPPRRRGAVVLVAILAGLAVWSLVAWVGYLAVDPVLKWIAASAGILIDGGKSIAAVAGVGKEVGAITDTINATGLLGQILLLVQAIAKPIIVVGWALGSIAIVAAPFILRRMGGLRGLRFH